MSVLNFIYNTYYFLLDQYLATILDIDALHGRLANLLAALKVEVGRTLHSLIALDGSDGCRVELLYLGEVLPAFHTLEICFLAGRHVKSGSCKGLFAKRVDDLTCSRHGFCITSRSAINVDALQITA